MSLGNRLTQWTPALLSKIQVLLGERGSAGERAVRESDLEKVIEAVYSRLTADIQAQRLVISDRTNLVPNAEFKESCAGWTKLTDGGSTVDSYSGVLGDGVTISKAAAALTAGARTDGFDLLPAHSLKPGEQVYISMFAQRQSGTDVGTVGLRARVFNSDGTSALVTLVSITSTPLLQTVPLQATYTAPALASGLSFEVFYDAGAGDPAGVVVVTQILVRRRLGGELIVEGTLTADKGVFGVGVNLFPNASMDFNGAGYVDVSGAAAYAEPYSGPLGRGVRLVTPVAGEASGWRNTVDLTRPLVSARPGEQFRLSAKVTSNAFAASALAGFIIRQFFADGTITTTTLASGHAVSLPGTGLSANISATYTVPANCIGVNFRLGMQSAATGGNDATITDIFVRRLADGPDIRADSIIITGPAQMGPLTVETLAIGNNAVTLPIVNRRSTNLVVPAGSATAITLTNTTDLDAISSPSLVNLCAQVQCQSLAANIYGVLESTLTYETRASGVWTLRDTVYFQTPVFMLDAFNILSYAVNLSAFLDAPPVGNYDGERWIWKVSNPDSTNSTITMQGDTSTFFVSAINFKK